jgi:hypothetical protein
MSPGEYGDSYAKMFTWFWTGSDWLPRRAPIINYLQSGMGTQSANAVAAEGTLRRALDRATGIKNVNYVKTFNYVEYDYINNSIHRCFIGKACPWEIQEMLQLASEVGALSEPKLLNYCLTSLGVDCGGFVANYWGEACPHMVNVAPPGWNGISPRSFWSNTQLFPDVMSRRRPSLESIRQGDAIIFFKDIVKGDPDIVKKGSRGAFIEGSGSEAFHIGIVEGISASTVTIAESSGAKKSLGGNGVGVREAKIAKIGKSSNGKWVHAQMGEKEWLYFVAPPWGWGPETAYNIGES